MKATINLLVLVILAAASLILAEESNNVLDPYKNEVFDCADKPDGYLYIYGFWRFRIFEDMNFNGRKDLILSEKDSSCGSGGCIVALYLNQDDGSYLRESFKLHPNAVNLQKIETGKGMLSIYWHISAWSGILETYEITSDSFINTSSKEIEPNGSDKELYDSLFNDKVKLHVEYAKSKGGKLQWSNSNTE